MTASRQLRSWLVLGRVSNLPTVWSNCLAGWLLAGDGSALGLTLVIVSVSLFYIGGMFLNDVYDAAFDARYRPERPIPALLISRTTVGVAGVSSLVSGLGVAASLGRISLGLGTVLVATILCYDLFHKQFALSPVLMGACRLFVYLLAGSTAGSIVPSTALFGGALACYVGGISVLARTESKRSEAATWWLPLLLAPVVTALSVHHSIESVGLCAPLLVCIFFALWQVRFSIGQAVSLLLAGIVTVDLLAVSPASLIVIAAFAVLFSSTFFLQRFIPAT